MQLNNQELFELLTEKEIHYVYHANTVATTITYIQRQGLLSRGAVEDLGLYQTPQGSDVRDKVMNVFNDVFVDTTDLHTYFSRQNYYGPVLFKLTTDFITAEDFGIWVTKNNPQYWNDGMQDTDKYFVSVQELRERWDDYERQRKMITIRNNTVPILFPYISEVIVDNPNCQIGQTNFLTEAVKGLKEALIPYPLLKNKFDIRHAHEGCYCQSNYLQQMPVNDLSRLFLPQNVKINYAQT